MIFKCFSEPGEGPVDTWGRHKDRGKIGLQPPNRTVVNNQTKLFLCSTEVNGTKIISDSYLRAPKVFPATVYSDQQRSAMVK